MSEREEAREAVQEAMARSAELYGMNRSYGRLYGVLFFADEALSLDELVEQSGYAKSTVSDAMKTLERIHMVRRRSRPGEGKRVFFEVERDLWRVVQDLLQSEVRREIQIMGRALDDAESKLEAADDPGAERDLERLRELRSIYDQSVWMVNVLSRVPFDRLRSLLEQLKRE